MNIDNSDNIEWVVKFLEYYLPKLPDHAIIFIFDLLDAEYIKGFFLYFPNDIIHQLLVQQYYSQLLHFQIADGNDQVDVTMHDYTSNPFVSFYGVKNILRFMNDFPEIVPRRLVFIGEIEKRILDDARISKIEEIEIILETLENYKDLRSGTRDLVVNSPN
ncbi:uncharacterized protein SPAPADRAFT_51217 [Spathaspora passalidarum NRRL Y-27907]|uniref:Uncharacterized protein n=1 Tax=Spathaspora passalidarum (strain NRRL Y-27907 / 11-Y1) TaxID=619300 RepID=G3AQV4_SPAPN|nr:uncharacterized protein SPAPADRAFT_51217 [Spathaspora passalidarum NRRL Y-27907]EGW31183.1 hypothetical protein SPAPADRAFT_51217 [Spathaspora passalidarum NRRL Y-27907]